MEMANHGRPNESFGRFRRAQFLLAKKGSFAEAFPTIADFRIEVAESGDAIWGRESNGKRVYTKTNPPGEYHNCSNSSCYNGGIAIGGIVRSMVAKGETHSKESAICQGYEGSPKGRRQYRRCLHHFTVEVSLTYQDAIR
jgi:hypothetical protein